MTAPFHVGRLVPFAGYVGCFVCIALTSGVFGCQSQAVRSPAELAAVSVAPEPSLAASAAVPIASAAPAPSLAKISEARTLPSGLVIQDQVRGTGVAVVEGSQVVVHYEGSLVDGTAFDSSRKRQQPFEFTVGQGAVIPGFEEGMLGMRVGGRRTLTIPPQLAYGARGAPPTIPPHSVLVFELELLELR